MTENKQYPGVGAAPYPTQDAIGQQHSGGCAGTANPGFEMPLAAGFAVGAPGSDQDLRTQGVGLVGPPPMGFHMPMPALPQPNPADEGPKHSDGKSGESHGDTNGFDFSNKTIRRAFIKKVYGIVSVQLLLTASIIAIFSFHEGVKGFVLHTSGIVIASCIIAIVLFLVISCCESVRRKSPHNVILLGFFTLTYGFVIGVLSSLYAPKAVALAAGITTLLTIGLTIFAFQTKIDFTLMGGILFCCVMVMFIFGILLMFLPQVTFAREVYACLGALLFSVYLVYDTQLMIGGKHKFSISPEEYVLAAIHIYMDVIMIFWHLLRMEAPCPSE